MGYKFTTPRVQHTLTRLPKKSEKPAQRGNDYLKEIKGNDYLKEIKGPQFITWTENVTGSRGKKTTVINLRGVQFLI